MQAKLGSFWHFLCSWGETITSLNIYILGHTLERIQAPLLWVNRVYKDMTTGEAIQEREEFVECLTHDSIIIQIYHPQSSFRRHSRLSNRCSLCFARGGG